MVSASAVPSPGRRLTTPAGGSTGTRPPASVAGSGGRCAAAGRGTAARAGRGVAASATGSCSAPWATASFSRGVTWGGLPQHARRVATVATAAFLAAGVAGPALASVAEAATPSTADLVSVIVQERSGTGNGPERAVEAFGGSVGQEY